jgi:hypothetical protein
LRPLLADPDCVGFGRHSERTDIDIVAADRLMPALLPKAMLFEPVLLSSASNPCAVLSCPGDITFQR